mmetsp:Transcript_95790/g.266099  ORF Transcript_95790/g.266099 Transcript_95790/m.266099 type:complete len:296 (+) Transcript_95790:2206-3093(+)
MLLEGALVVHLHRMAEHDRVRHLHHGGLQVQGEEHTLLRGLQLLLVELPQGRNTHYARIDNLSAQQGRLRLQHRSAIRVQQLDAHTADLVHRSRLLTPEEIAVNHVGHVALGVWTPRPQPVRMLLGVGLHWLGHAPVRVALSEHGVHGAPQHLGIARLDVVLLVGLWFRRVVWHSIALRLQLLDGGRQLRHGRGNVGELDDVGRRSLGQAAQGLQVVLYPLGRCEAVREEGLDARRQGDVLLRNLDAAHPAECPQHWQQGVSGEHGGLVRVGVHDLYVGDAQLHVSKLVEALHDA